MNPSHLLKVAGLTFALFAVSAVRGQIKQPAPPAPEPKPATLPLTRVVLFNAGVGYFHREGRVDGDAKLELRFPEADLNDLIKSLVLIDRDGGKVKPVTYDNRAPVEFTLRSFALDLTDNPTVGQLMHQARGEKVEVADKAGVVTSGKIVSVENPVVPTGQPHPGELLHILTGDGLQTVELRQSKKIKFVRAELQAEFHKALDILASAKGDSKKAVSVVFSGQGNRRVGLGYVTEAPLWKPTYRLTLDDKGAARLQGWAAIENTTDEDWVNVKVGLVAGRPMAFQMDLYDPLFIPRPLVESDLFASLRPPLYQGGLNPTPNAMAGMVGMGQNQGIGGNFAGFGGGGLGGFGGGQIGGNLGIQGNQFGNLGGQFGFQGYSQNGYVPRVPRASVRDLFGERLSHDDYVKRLKGQPVERPNAEEQKPRVTVKDHLDPEGGVLAAAGGGLGDMFEYTIEEPVSLGRQKSALLPIANEPVEGTKVSIFNAKTLAKHPLLGLKLVNKTKLHLAQGPVTVYEADTFAGDARLPDLKPGETRLISYTIDLGTEVVEGDGEHTSVLVSTQVAAGQLRVATRDRRTTKYLVRNRNPQDRAVVIEHPITANWKLTAPEKVDRSRDFYRFELTAKSGALTPLAATEEHDNTTWVALDKVSDDDVLRYSKSDVVKPAVKEVLAKVLELRNKMGAAEKEQAAELAALKEIADEQDRIRKNIERVPPTSEAYKRYLKKFDDQETEIEKRQAKVKELKAEAAKQQKALKEFVEGAKAE